MIAAFGAWVLKLMSSKVVGRVFDALDKKQDANSEIAKGLLQNEMDARAVAAKIRLATATFWEMRVMTGVIGISISAHFASVVLDSMFHFGWKIAKLPGLWDEWEGAIILSLFGLSLATKGLNAVTTIFLRRFL